MILSRLPPAWHAFALAHKAEWMDVAADSQTVKPSAEGGTMHLYDEIAQALRAQLAQGKHRGALNINLATLNDVVRWISRKAHPELYRRIDTERPRGWNYSVPGISSGPRTRLRPVDRQAFTEALDRAGLPWTAREQTAKGTLQVITVDAPQAPAKPQAKAETWMAEDLPAQDELLSRRAKAALRQLIADGGTWTLVETIRYDPYSEHVDNKVIATGIKALFAGMPFENDARRGTMPSGERRDYVTAEVHRDRGSEQSVRTYTVRVGPAAARMAALPDKTQAKALKALAKEEREQAKRDGQVQARRDGLEGTCGYCGRGGFLLALPEKVQLSQHGYTLRWGSRQGSCPGSREECLEISPRTLHMLQADLTADAERLRHRKGMLDAQPDPADVQERVKLRNARRETTRRLEWTIRALADTEAALRAWKPFRTRGG